MKQTSNAQSNDILNRLRENIENQNETVVTDETKPNDNPLSGEQLLEKLRLQVGEQKVASGSKEQQEDDYDISGFEIEEPKDEETVVTKAEEELVEPKESNDGTQGLENAVHNEIVEDSLPWETDASVIETVESHVDESVENEPLPIQHVNEISLEEDDSNMTVHEDEFDESLSEEVLPEEQEALKRQIELFVEKTIEPDEVFDYFEGLEKKAAKERELIEESKAPQKQEETVVLEEECQPVESDLNDQPVEAKALNDIREDVSAETTDIPEAEAVNPIVERFFFCDNAATEPDGKQSGVSEGDTATMDDTDINLLLALGKKQALEETVGFVRVREAKNNFYDPSDEESLGNHVFAYDGEEFRDPSQIGTIKTRYRKEKKILWLRFAGTLCLALLALIIDFFSSSSVKVPFVSAFLQQGPNYLLISLLLVVLGMVLSFKPLLDGARGFVFMRPNRFTPFSVIVFANITYDIAVLLFFRESRVPIYSFAILAFLFISVIGDIIRLTRETMTFDIISDPREKFALEKADPAPEISREERILLNRDLLVEKVSFVGKYFARTARRSTAHAEYFVELLVTLIAASFVAIGVAVVQKDLLSAMTAFILVLIVCMPMQHLVGSYPFGRLSKLLYRHGSAVIGEAVDREYVGANTVYLDDTEVFGHHGVSISGLRTYGDANFYSVLYHALAVFSRMEGPLRYVFENSSHEIERAEDVELLKIYAHGIEALVDGSTRVLIGNAVFMSDNHFVTKQTEEDARKIENGEASILYMAMNGTLCAKFYMKYTVTKRFEAFVSEMHENNTSVGVRTLDPNVTEEMLSLLRKDKGSVISVIRPTLNDLVPMGRRSDSSIITAKNSHMIARILALCGRVKKINHVWVILRACSMLTALLAVSILIFAQKTIPIPSVAIVIYQLLWLIPPVIYTATKLK